jgi:cell division protein FtsB
VTNLRKLPHRESGLRAVMARVPQAEEFAASWVRRIRPTLVLVYGLRRRIATIAVAVLTLSLFVHVMFGANGMVVYRQKRAEYKALQRQIADTQRDNEAVAAQIQGLKSDQQAIEKEAREQLGYAKPGEYVYVAPASAAKPAPPPATRSARK